MPVHVWVAAWAEETTPKAAMTAKVPKNGWRDGFMGFWVCGDEVGMTGPSQPGSDIDSVAEHVIFRYRSNQGYFPWRRPDLRVG